MPGSRTSRQRRRALAALAVPLAAIVLASCASAQESPDGEAGPGSASAGSATAQVVLDPPLDHLHGLHLGADGAVLAGTHTGVFEVERSGRTMKVGESDDDFMGLSGVPGTNNLFASGHPGRSSSAPNPLGLTASSDGGRTWESRSLVGEIDFHALATDGEVLIGFDGVTGLIVSKDGGSTWTPGAPMHAAALAATDSGIWAATADGLQHSLDAGRTFAVVPGAPLLVRVSAAGDGSLWGVDTGGVAWRSHNGEVWEQRDVVGPVEAVLAVDFNTAYAMTAQTLYTLD
ncbi:F510_1955 family glycosylhydrolase [Tomitella biformata]|uniref:F510_1955 family glycosylhydrolase n=1 Tax=Tomitella biformata TaxID=630403 RepID=UPI00046722FF|nr:glycosyl hydrolase [Tomitella biformata]